MLHSLLLKYNARVGAGIGAQIVAGIDDAKWCGNRCANCCWKLWPTLLANIVAVVVGGNCCRNCCECWWLLFLFVCARALFVCFRGVVVCVCLRLFFSAVCCL